MSDRHELSSRKLKIAFITCAILFTVVLFSSSEKNLTSFTYNGLKFDDTSEFPNLLAGLLILSIIVERATEVLLSSTRSAKADELDEAIKEVSELPKPLNEEQIQLLTELRKDRSIYRTESRHLAQTISLVLSFLLALVGVRVLNSMLEVKGDNLYFHFVDVLLTTTVVAGGTDAINKAMKTYSAFMSPKSSRV